ncbi:hypothetical protein G7054_g10143 [Neopestalotiopsis clavispora]|nr:hypothetical protein G7054_g10143 [Neopestalotiopsis clavispora]
MHQEVPSIIDASHDEIIGILQNLHPRRDGLEFHIADLPYYLLPAYKKVSLANYSRGERQNLRDILDLRRGEPPDWYPARLWEDALCNILTLIKKIGHRECVNDKEIDAAFGFLIRHRWDLRRQIDVEPFASGIANSTHNDTLSKLPSWVKSFSAIGRQYLMMAACVPASSRPSDGEPLQNNHWIGGLVDVQTRTLYVVDSYRAGRETRAALLLLNIQRYWARYSVGQDIALQPTRARCILSYPQEDTWSCGLRVIDWFMRLLYWPSSILRPSYPTEDFEKFWVQTLAQFIGVDFDSISLPQYNGQPSLHPLCLTRAAPVVDMTNSEWKREYRAAIDSVRAGHRIPPSKAPRRGS